MDVIINLELADKDAYKESFKEDFKNLSLIDIIFETLGCVEKNDNKKLKIKININKENIFISHNSNNIDNTDIPRLLKIATHGLNEKKKGVSKHGIGWRGIADA
jgi:hypothetical protein